MDRTIRYMEDLKDDVIPRAIYNDHKKNEERWYKVKELKFERKEKL
jgi:hypothetical protein